MVIYFYKKLVRILILNKLMALKQVTYNQELQILDFIVMVQDQSNLEQMIQKDLASEQMVKLVLLEKTMVHRVRY